MEHLWTNTKNRKYPLKKGNLSNQHDPWIREFQRTGFRNCKEHWKRLFGPQKHTYNNSWIVWVWSLNIDTSCSHCNIDSIWRTLNLCVQNSKAVLHHKNNTSLWIAVSIKIIIVYICRIKNNEHKTGSPELHWFVARISLQLIGWEVAFCIHKQPP